MRSPGFVSSVGAIGSEVAMPAMDVAASDSQTASSERNMEIMRRLGNFEWALIKPLVSPGYVKNMGGTSREGSRMMTSN